MKKSKRNPLRLLRLTDERSLWKGPRSHLPLKLGVVRVLGKRQVGWQILKCHRFTGGFTRNIPEALNEVRRQLRRPVPSASKHYAIVSEQMSLFEEDRVA